MRQINKIILTLCILTLVLLTLREIDYHQKGEAVGHLVHVFVSGEVNNPGAVSLPSGARRLHAIAKCGGLTTACDVASSELTRVLKDGESIHLQTLTASKATLPVTTSQSSGPVEPGARQDLPPQTTEKQSSRPNQADLGKIKLNSATLDQLDLLPGIGPVTANRILTARQQQPGGVFRAIEDLATIRGISQKTLQRIQPYLELEGL